MPTRPALPTLLLAGALSSLIALPATARAEAPMVRTQAPGYYRMMLGDFEITALSDGTVELPVDKLLTDTTTGRIRQALKRSFLSAPLETSVNGYLVNPAASWCWWTPAPPACSARRSAGCSATCAPPATSPNRWTRC